jgi:hypothetical protein
MWMVWGSSVGVLVAVREGVHLGRARATHFENVRGQGLYKGEAREERQGASAAVRRVIRPPRAKGQADRSLRAGFRERLGEAASMETQAIRHSF